jgi:hypothetical protein
LDDDRSDYRERQHQAAGKQGREEDRNSDRLEFFSAYLTRLASFLFWVCGDWICHHRICHHRVMDLAVRFIVIVGFDSGPLCVRINYTSRGTCAEYIWLATGPPTEISFLDPEFSCG